MNVLRVLIHYHQATGVSKMMRGLAITQQEFMFHKICWPTEKLRLTNGTAPSYRDANWSLIVCMLCAKLLRQFKSKAYTRRGWMDECGCRCVVKLEALNTFRTQSTFCCASEQCTCETKEKREMIFEYTNKIVHSIGIRFRFFCLFVCVSVWMY